RPTENSPNQSHWSRQHRLVPGNELGFSSPLRRAVTYAEIGQVRRFRNGQFCLMSRAEDKNGNAVGRTLLRFALSSSWRDRLRMFWPPNSLGITAKPRSTLLASPAPDHHTQGNQELISSSATQSNSRPASRARRIAPLRAWPPGCAGRRRKRRTDKS